MMKMTLNKSIKDEKGQALILVVILLLVGGLIVTPLLSYMGTGLIAGRVYEEKAADLYAADAGVEDGMWQIKYDNLTTKLPSYDPYAYGTPYVYPAPLDVNDRDVNVTIENIWIPTDFQTPEGIPAPSDPDDARVIIEGSGGDPPKLIITGSVPSTSTFKIKITYYPEAFENLEIKTLGIWLPPGFIYGPAGWDIATDPDPSNLNSTNINYTLQTQKHASGQAVVWTFSPSAYFAGSVGPPVQDPFPGVNPLDYPMTSEITFPFDGPAGQSPEAVSWIDTNLDLSGGINYTWDADTKVYKITSEAHRDITEPPDTTIDAYTAKSEIRELGSAIAGDYRAIGDTLMIDEDFRTPPIRDTLLPKSDATVADIPDDAEVTAAYLYWSAWLSSGSTEQIIWEDDCSDMANWIPGGDWSVYGWVNKQFRGHHIGSAPDKYLTLKSGLDLSSYAGETVTISWEQDESGRLEFRDRLYFQLSADGNFPDDFPAGNWIEAFRDDNPPSPFSYVIPDEYLTENFKIRFYLYGFDGWREYCYIDNIKISVQTGTIADTTAIFKIDGTQVYFDDGVPTQGAEEITASEWSLLENKPGTYSYSCYLDVTELVRTFSAEGDDGNYPGNATYTVGGVNGDTGDEWSYAGWSLILIYSSAETEGHQLYLYDDFIYSDMNCNVDFDSDGEDGGTISGFLVPDPIAGEVNAAKLTCFVGEGDDYYNGDSVIFEGTKLWDSTEAESLNDVWNAQSIGLSADGVDIDTFYVTWASNLLEPGDTSAQIDLPTQTDSWNLVYIIVSFRSATTTGGTITYLVRG